MGEQTWKPLFRGDTATISEVMQSPAFEFSRSEARRILENRSELLRLADQVEAIDQTNAPLGAISDQLADAVRFVRAKAVEAQGTREHGVDLPTTASGAIVETQVEGAVSAARERLVVAALHYLVTLDDLVPDFQPGGYIDDVLVLSWILGAAVDELAPYRVGAPRF